MYTCLSQGLRHGLVEESQPMSIMSNRFVERRLELPQDQSEMWDSTWNPRLGHHGFWIELVSTKSARKLFCFSGHHSSGRQLKAQIWKIRSKPFQNESQNTPWDCQLCGFSSSIRTQQRFQRKLTFLDNFYKEVSEFRTMWNHYCIPLWWQLYR